jgi:hypothetical protein
VVLAADEYRDGRVDWYSFRAASDLRSVRLRRPTPGDVLPPVLPVPVATPACPPIGTGSSRTRASTWPSCGGPHRPGAAAAGREFALAYGN